MADRVRELRVEVPRDHPAFAGHFPGHPLLPGVTLLAQAQEALLADDEAASWFREGATLSAVKFLAPVGPGAALRVQWTVDASRRRAQVQVWRLAADDADGGVLACTAQLEAPAA